MTKKIFLAIISKHRFGVQSDLVKFEGAQNSQTPSKNLVPLQQIARKVKKKLQFKIINHVAIVVYCNDHTTMFWNNWKQFYITYLRRFFNSYMNLYHMVKQQNIFTSWRHMKDIHIWIHLTTIYQEVLRHTLALTRLSLLKRSVLTKYLFSR